MNAGSVGKPKTNRPDANYVIINIKNEDEFSKESDSVEVEIVQVPYDVEKIAREIEENEILPSDFARLIREGSSK